MEGKTKVLDFGLARAMDFGGRLSPGGRVIGYLSDVSGTTEAYGDSVPKPSSAHWVATAGRPEHVSMHL